MNKIRKEENDRLLKDIGILFNTLIIVVILILLFYILTGCSNNTIARKNTQEFEYRYCSVYPLVKHRHYKKDIKNHNPDTCILQEPKRMR